MSNIDNKPLLGPIVCAVAKVIDTIEVTDPPGVSLRAKHDSPLYCP